MHDLGLLTDLALIFAVAVGAAVVLARIGAPVVLAFVATGALLGPPGLGLVARDHALEVVAEVGVVLLLFTVGLEFSLGELRRAWRAVLVAGGVQVGGTVAGTAVVAAALGRPPAEAVVWGFLVALSSTAVVLRLLDARGEAKAAHGRLVLGVLVFQDLMVVPMLLAIPLLAGEASGTADIARVVLVAVAVVGGTLLAAQRVVPPLLARVARARNREVFLLAVLAVAGVTAWLTSLAGLSLALGAFLAGMVLADTDYAHQALADVLPLRTVMMCVFFVSIGMLLDIDVVLAAPAAVGALVGAVLVGKFAAAWLAGVVVRAPVRVAALAAAALAQVGEFSFVIAEHAVDAHLLTDLDARRFIAASVVSIAIAPLAVAASPRWLAGSPALRPFERLLDRRDPEVPRGEPEADAGHVLVAGFGVGGRTVVAALEQAGIPLVVLDVNGDVVARERARGRRMLFGDASAPEVLEHAGLRGAVALVVVINDFAAAHRTVEVARALRPDLPIVLRTRWAAEEGRERGPGVTVVSEEFAGAAAVAAAVLRQAGVAGWSTEMGRLVQVHEAQALPEGEEDALGPPPVE